MHRRRLFIMVAVFCWLFASMAHAQLPQISSGLSYLTSTQNPDGTWNTSTSQTETTTATASVLETLKLLNQTAGTPYTAGAAWLQAQTPQTVNYIAERLHALDLSDTSSLIPSVDANGGGWGGDAGYETNPLDTSLALQALKSANYADTTIINPTLAYLTSSQNSDGGWGFYPGDASNVFITAIVSVTLQQIPQTATIATAVSKATAYLLAHQNPDGGFGTPSAGSGQGSPSTVYETALAYAALAAVTANEAALSSAAAYLTANQSANGSWNNDPYSTALALKALYLSENRPSPPPPPPAGGKFTGTVVDAITLQKVAGVTVALTSNSLINTVTDAGGNFTLQDIPPGVQTLNLSLAGFAPATATATAIADVTTSLGTIPLTSAANTGTISGTVLDPNGKPLADVAIAVTGAWSGSTVTGADGTFSFNYVTPGDVTITASKTGYQTFTGSGRVYARTTLSISPRLNVVTSQLTTGTIVGRVVSATWGLPIDHLPEEQGVRVTISGGAYVEPDPNNGGEFSITGLAPNTYQVTVGMNGFVSQTFRLIVAPGVTTDLGTIRLVMSASTMTLVGRISDAVTGLPIPGAEIFIPATGQTARSDFAGTYAIADINVFQFSLRASAAGYVAKTVDLYQAGSRGAIWTQTVDLSLVPQATRGDLTGRVVDALTGQPLAGATVAATCNPAVNTITGSDGVFTLSALALGLQQATVTLDGFNQRTVGGVIFPCQTNDAGDIFLSPSLQTAVIRGTVRNAATGAPLVGVLVSVGGSGNLQAVTGDDGSYVFADVPPGAVTIDMTKAGYYPARISAPLAVGGLLVYTPALAGSLPVTVSATVQTDKPVYAKGDTAGINVSLVNRESRDLAATLRLRVIAPDDTTVHEEMLDAALAADGMRSLSVSYPLPVSLQGGVYAVTAELFDAVGTWVGAASGSFGIAVSRITVTPNLPQRFSAGANTLLFNLANSGELPVAAGLFKLALKDPTGQTVATAEQPFSLSPGEGKTLSLGVSIPQLTFGTYSLVYSQSDETRDGSAVTIPLDNSIGITAVFDSNSHRVRSSTTLTVTLTNTGRFALDAPLPVTVAVPDAAYTETKSMAGVPPAGSTLVYSFTIPATVTSGEHNAIITAALPTGSGISSGAKLVIFESALALEPLPTGAAAGETITLNITNSGGVDTPVQYRFSLYDASSKSVAETIATETAPAGTALPVLQTIPSGTVDGVYSLVASYKDATTGKEDTLTGLLTISGVKGTLQVTTGKASYLPTESITGQSSITNTGSPLQNANLHLQVTNASGSRQQRTWTSQFDFQQGVRSGVDTVETPDSVTLLPYADDFTDGVFNQDRWISSRSATLQAYPPVEANGSLLLTLPSNPANTWISNNAISNFRVSGDFDASVDYRVTSPWNVNGNNHAAGLQVFADNWNVRIDVWGWTPTYGVIDSYGYYTNINYALTNGKFRIKRTGSTFYAYVWNGTTWYNLYNFGQRTTNPVGFTLLSFGQGGSVQVLYDNFKLANITYPPSGTMNLKYDSGVSDTWDKLSYNADTPAGTAIKFRTRTAETEAGLAGATWSSYITESNSPITSPKGRWIEVETTLSTTSTAVTPVLRDLTVAQGHNPGDIFWQADIPVNLAAGATITPASTMGTLDQAGKYYLQGTLTSGTGQTVATAESPFYVVQGNMVITLGSDKRLYKPGTPVIVSGSVSNLATADATNLALAIKAKTTGAPEQVLLSDSFSLHAGGSRPFTVTTTAGADGTIFLTGTVTQSSAVLAAVADQFEVASPKVTAVLVGPDSAGSDAFTLSLSLTNSGKTDAIIAIAKNFTPESETIVVPAGQSRNLQYSRQITADSSFLFTLSGDYAGEIGKKVFYVKPVQTAAYSARVTADKVSYNAREQAVLTYTVTCLEADGKPVSATILVVDANGTAVYSATPSLPLLDAGKSFTGTITWNSAGYSPGTYAVRLLVENASATLASATASFSIIGSSQTATGVSGTVASAQNPAYIGIPLPLSWSLRNNGNENLQTGTVTVTLVDPDNGAVMQSASRELNLAVGETLSDQFTAATTALAPRDYLAVLQVILPGMSQPKTVAWTSCALQQAPPPTLSVSSLASGSITNIQTLNIAGTASSPVGIKSLSINETTISLTSDGSFSHALLLQEGNNTVTTTVTDISDGTTSDSRTIILDRQAPYLTVTAPADNSKTSAALTTVSGTVDETSTVKVSMGETSQAAAMNGTVFAADLTLQPGWNTIEVTATDLAGNPSSQKRSVLFDDQKPSLEITEPSQDTRTNKGSLTIGGKASDPYSAVGITVSVDGAMLNPTVVDGIFSQVVSFGEEKLYPIVVTATNEVGTQTTAQRNVIYDRTPPLLTIDPVTSPTNAALQVVTGTREEGRSVTVACPTAAVGEVEYPTPTTWRVALSGLQPGENRLEAASADLAGNGSLAAATILYLPKAPEVTITATPNLLWPPDKKLVPVVISGEIMTFGADVGSVTVNVADEYGNYNQQGLEFGDTAWLEAWRDGRDKDGRVYTITAVVTDRAGNVTTRTATVIVPHDMGK